jgi:FKBP-type peptidyl-prolyl cis-trans isomerase FkpA
LRRTIRWTALAAAIAFALALLTLGGARMGLLSGKRPVAHLGVEAGKLKPVRTNYWNAVSSFATSDYHRIDPLRAGDDPQAGFGRLRAIVIAFPGATVITESPGYLYAEFTTPVLKFVDDVEFLLDASAGVIHVRSASRLGRKDLGVNRKRIEAIRARLDAANAAASSTSPQGNNGMNQQTLPSGLKIEDVTVGGGDEARAGANVRVHYTGWLYENGTAGRKFDSSKDRGEPFSFPLGAGHVIRGWDEGVAGMKVGGTRRLIIPADLGYGARGAGGVIPPNATLLFEVDLLGV